MAGDGLEPGARAALEGADGGMPGPGEQHGGAGAVLGLVREQGVTQLMEGPAVQFLQLPGGGPGVGQRPGLARPDRAMLDFAVKLTHTPEECEEGDVARLREAGFSDADILHIVEVTAIFNYNVRLATATGLFPNPEYHTLGRTSAREG